MSEEEQRIQRKFIETLITISESKNVKVLYTVQAYLRTIRPAITSEDKCLQIVNDIIKVLDDKILASLK